MSAPGQEPTPVTDRFQDAWQPILDLSQDQTSRDFKALRTAKR